jgi:hypothetical protein
VDLANVAALEASDVYRPRDIARGSGVRARETVVFVNNTMLVERLASRFGMEAWVFYHHASEGAAGLSEMLTKPTWENVT